eukprot:Rmarinus@m.8228
MPRLSLLSLFFVLLACGLFKTTFSHSGVDVFPLRPDRPRKDQHLEPGHSLIYILVEMQADSEYELRISYPSWIPAEFEIDIFVEPLSAMDSFVGEELRPQHGRKISNIEKVSFKTNEEGYPSGVDAVPLSFGELSGDFGVFAEVSATLTGVSDDPSFQDYPIVYNIVLESLWFGVPASTINMTICGVLMVIFGALLVRSLLPIFATLRKPVQKTSLD